MIGINDLEIVITSNYCRIALDGHLYYYIKRQFGYASSKMKD